MSAARHLYVCTALAAIFFASVAHAQNNRIWVGSATPDNKWTTIGNWNLGVPGSADTAFFNNAGNANTNVDLGGTAQPIGTIEFDNGITPSYTLGALASGDKFNFDVGGSIIETSTVGQAQTINADMQLTNGTISDSGDALTLNGNIVAGGAFTITNHADTLPGTTTTLGGNITEVAGAPASLTFGGSTAAGASSIFIIKGTNTYTGPTSITVDTGAGGNIEIGSNSPFGTGLVTLTLVTTAPQFSAVGGDHTIPNALKLNAGMTYTGTNSLTLSGPITVFNPAASGGRTLGNQIISIGKSVALGAAPNSSTITLGGADGIGKVLNFAPSAGSTTVVNDVIQDPAVGGGAASGIVQFSGSTGITRINGLNTYTGGTQLNGSSTVQIGSDSNVGGSSGPFGAGTLTANSTTNNVLQPVGGDRTVANPISMIIGVTVGNAGGDNSGLTLSGPITMAANGRTLTNNMSAGTLTLGSVAAPSTWTLPTAGGQTVSIIGGGATVINDVIQDAAGAPSPAAAISLAGTGPVTLNALNNYAGGTTITGQAENVRFGSSSNGLPGATFTAGPLGTGAVTLNNTTTAPVLQPIGADRTISNAITMTSGFTASNVSGTPYSLTLAGPITLGATSRIISNNIPTAAALTLGAAAAPSTFAIGSTLTIQSQVAGAGSTIVNDKLTGIGGLTVQGGAVVQLNNAANDFAGATTVSNTGSKLLVNGAKAGAGTVTINASGTLGGTGTISGTIANSGTIAPGVGVGTLTTTGNVLMAANSHLAIELGGGTADKLAVGGNLDLSASEFLDVTGAGSGLSWVIATYTGTLAGTFNHVTTGYTVNYGTGTNSQITLNAALSGVKGDYNNNGRVDAADYVLWRNNVGAGTPLPNDNGLGTPIGQAQYDLWRTNFNKPGSGSGSLESGEVPEPISLMLLGIALISMTSIRSRR